VVSSKKKWTAMNPIRRQMKKRKASSGHNDQLVHWWLLVHSGPSPSPQTMQTKHCKMPFKIHYKLLKKNSKN
jgi:hypothetical protein